MDAEDLRDMMWLLFVRLKIR